MNNRHTSDERECFWHTKIGPGLVQPPLPSKKDVEKQARKINAFLNSAKKGKKMKTITVTVSCMIVEENPKELIRTAAAALEALEGVAESNGKMTSSVSEIEEIEEA